MRAGRRALRRGLGPANRHALVGPEDLWEPKRRFQFEFLTSHGLRPQHRLLDIGCGTLRGGLPLIEYLQPGHYTGIEARAAVLEEGRKELTEAGLTHKQPVLVCASDPAQIELDAPFDFVWAFSVLIHLSDELVDGYLRLVARSLTESGKFYANVMLGERRAAQWQGFPVLSRPRDSYQAWAEAHALSMAEVGTLEQLGHRMGTGDREVMLCFRRAASVPGPDVSGRAAART